MSGTDRSGSSSESEEDDLGTTGLIATRAKRVTAGNLYATLRANLDDEELQKELLAEEEEGDAGDYEGSDKDDDDDAFDSSSDDEDAGPAKAGDVEDLEGEKALKKQERVEARKKRKVHEARLKLPAWQKRKRVKLADDVKVEDGSTSDRPKKKSERANWLPSAVDGPVRQSGRSLAVANREVVHANLKQSAERSEKQRRVMKDAAERDESRKRMQDMTQEERLKKCEKVEKETGRELGRWETEERERQRLRDEALAAKRKKGIDGPYIRFWSGSALWEGERIKIRRMSHGSTAVDKIDLGGKREPTTNVTAVHNAPDSDGKALLQDVPTLSVAQSADSKEQTPSQQDVKPIHSASMPQVLSKDAAPVTEAGPEVQPPTPWLQGIEEYARQTGPRETPYMPSAPTLSGLPTTSPPRAQPLESPVPANLSAWPPGTSSFSISQAPVAPLTREQARRTLLMLENFPSLSTATVKKTPKSKQLDHILDNGPVKSILLPESHATFSAEEQKYLLTRPRKNAVLPPAPPKPRCAVTSWPAKFRDPKTGLCYADVHQYKVIQRIIAGGCCWSGLLGAWVGPTMGATGRCARGCPEGFATGKKFKVEASSS